MSRTHKYIYSLIDKEGKKVFEGSALDISLKYYTEVDNVYGCWQKKALLFKQYKLTRKLNPEYRFTKLTPLKPLHKDGKYYCSNCGEEVNRKWKCCPKCEWRLEK